MHNDSMMKTDQARMVQVPILIPQIVGKPNFQRLHLQDN